MSHWQWLFRFKNVSPYENIFFQVYPGWQAFDEFVVKKLHKALKVDALLNTRPMTHYAERPADILELFDPISYEKGKRAANEINKFKNYLIILSSSRICSSHVFTRII